MAERSESAWMMWLAVAGGFAVCCGLPFVALALAVGSTAAVLTGALWVAGGSAGIAAMLAGIYLARRRTAAKRVAVVPLEDVAPRSASDQRIP